MAWYKVDDKLHSHPKARQAGLAAIGLWTLAGSHCMDYLTDGLVETWFVESFPDGLELAERLVAAGMWDRDPKGYRFHDWLEYQPTAQKVRETREARAAAGQKGGVKSGESRREASAEAKREAIASAKTKQKRTPSPVPSPGTSSKTSKSQSLDNRARDSTDSFEVSAVTRMQAAHRGIKNLPAIAAAIRDRLHVAVDAFGAMSVANHLLEKAKKYPDAPDAYVLRCIELSPAEVQTYIYDSGLAA